MAKFIIEGGRHLQGEVQTNSAKNSAVAILCATTMLEGKTVLGEIPLIEEVNRIIEVLVSIGLEISWTGKHQLTIVNPGSLDLDQLDQIAFIKTRSAIMLLGALAFQEDNFSLPHPSGCKLGKRTLNPHLIAFEHLGVRVEETCDSYRISRQEKGELVEFVMYESSDVGTENAMLAAALRKGKTIIHFASPNYMVQDLGHFLIAAGAKIEGLGTSKLVIEGVEKLQPVRDYPIMPDPIESMAFISLAITTGSNLKVLGCPLDFLRLEIEKLRVMGQKLEVGPSYKSTNDQFDLVDIEVIPSKLRALPDKVYGRPYPGLNLDNLPLFVPIITQAKGQTLVHDWAYENRAIYFMELNKLGADIRLMDPHRVLVNGPTKFVAGEIICPPALRPSINLLIGMLAAPGHSILRNAYAIDRGYENIEGRLRELGADIKRVSK